MIDMEQDKEPPIKRPTMRDLDKYLRGQDYTQFSPQAVLMMFASVCLRKYDPRIPPQDQTQYCQMQFSFLPDGVGTGSVRHRRMITQTGDRIIGHNLIDHHFTQVRPDDRIRQTDPAGYPLPFANTDEFLAAERRERAAEDAAKMVAPIQTVAETNQIVADAAPPAQTQAEVTESTITHEPLIVAGTTDVATAGDVVEGVAAVTTQKTRRVNSKPKATTGQEAESSLTAGNLTIEITTAPADENEATTRQTETLMTENVANETTPAPASAVTGVEEQLVGAIVPPAQLDQSTGQATAADAQEEDLEALLLAVTANTGTNVASVSSVVDDQENANGEQPVSSGSNTQQDVEVAELTNVSHATDDEDSEDDQPIITFVSASAGTNRGRAVHSGAPCFPENDGFNQPYWEINERFADRSLGQTRPIVGAKISP